MILAFAPALAAAQTSPEAEAEAETEAETEAEAETETEAEAESGAEAEAGAEAAVEAEAGAEAGAEAAPNPGRFEVGGFPAIAYNSYYGVIFGAALAVTRFDPGFSPFHYRIQQTAVMSLRGSDTGIISPLQTFETKLELPGLRHGRLRIFGIARYQRIGLSGYFGIGNAASPVIPDDYTGVRDRYFTYRRDTVELRAFGRQRLAYHLELVFGTSMRGVFPTPHPDGAFDRDIAIARTQADPTLRGYERNFVFDGLLGLLVDTRDDEFNPSSGMTHELSIRMGGGPSGDAKLLYGSVYLNTRWFAPLIGEKLVLALRGIADVGFGRMPIIEMLTIGGYSNFSGPAGQEGNRGLPLGRQAGRVKLIANLELRSTFFRWTSGSHRFALGAVAFVDGSRVSSAGRPDPVLDERGFDVLWSFGGGARFLWNSAFVLRIDFAYSTNSGVDRGSSNALHVLLGHAF